MKITWRKQTMDALGFSWRAEDERGRWLASAGRNPDMRPGHERPWQFIDRNDGRTIRHADSFDDVKRRVAERRAEK